MSISGSAGYDTSRESSSPTSESGPQVLQGAVLEFCTSLLLCPIFRKFSSKMSTRDIEGEWRSASYFLAKGPSASVQYLQKDVKSQLFALKTQALDGDCPPGQDGSIAMDPSLRIRQEAWNALSGMSREEAKMRFVDLLSEVLPEWKKWSADHAPRASSDEEHESEADRLVKAFKARLGSNASTQFSRL